MNNRYINLQKKSLFIVLVVFLICALIWQPAFAFTTYGLDWDVVDYPARSFNQTFSNVNGTDVNVNFMVSAVSPTTNAELTNLVDGTAYSGAGTNTVQSLVGSANFTDDNNQITITVQFSMPVSNVSFTMHDIDRSQLFDLFNIGWIYYFDFMDRVEFQALSSDGITPVQPVFTDKGACVELIGAVAQGTGLGLNDTSCYDANNSTSARSDVTVTFPGEITQFQFTLGNVTNKTNWNVNWNPTLQHIGLGDISFSSAYDYGDLPDSYGTPGLTGARHYVPAAPAIYLGSSMPDDEFLAHVSVDALGDGGDEDAFTTFPGIGVNATSFTLTVPLVNTSSASAYLDGWIDFNMDGVFDASEYATTTVAVNQTSADLVWNSLPQLTAGNTFARLRLSSNHNAVDLSTSVGSAPDGEVEDYSVIIQTATAITLASFSGSATNRWGVSLILSAGMLISSLWIAIYFLRRPKRSQLSHEV